MKHNSITQSDMNLDFDGMAGNGVNRGSNKFAGNMHSGVQNPDKLITGKRGPTGGGTAMPTIGKDMFIGKPQQRQAVGDGASTAMPKTGQTKFDFARGPTKGNQL
jgi:hypothetical protein